MFNKLLQCKTYNHKLIINFNPQLHMGGVFYISPICPMLFKLTNKIKYGPKVSVYIIDFNFNKIPIRIILIE